MFKVISSGLYLYNSSFFDKFWINSFSFILLFSKLSDKILFIVVDELFTSLFDAIFVSVSEIKSSIFILNLFNLSKLKIKYELFYI